MDINRQQSAGQDRMQNLLLDSASFGEFMLELAVIAATRLSSSKRILCSITVERGTSLATVASSSEQAMVLDERQYAMNHGPCLSALRGQRPIFVPDLAAAGDWADYAREIQFSGVAAIFAIPVAAGPGTAAALNCYAFEAATMDATFRLDVATVAASFSGVLRLALRVHPAASAGSGYTPEMDSRAVVDAAIGLIMVQVRCSREEAFGRLGRLAFEHRSRIRDEAAAMLWEAKRSMGQS